MVRLLAIMHREDHAEERCHGVKISSGHAVSGVREFKTTATMPHRINRRRANMKEVKMRKVSFW